MGEKTTSSLEQEKKKKRSSVGCWTCRSRKIKCDNSRPTCNRCAKSRLSCQGYGIKLRWSKPLTTLDDGSFGEVMKDDGSGDSNNLTNSGGGYQGRSTSFMKFKTLYKYHDDLDRDMDFLCLSNLDKYKKLKMFKGPFGIIKAEEFAIGLGNKRKIDRKRIAEQENLQDFHQAKTGTATGIKKYKNDQNRTLQANERSQLNSNTVVSATLDRTNNFHSLRHPFTSYFSPNDSDLRTVIRDNSTQVSSERAFVTDIQAAVEKDKDDKEGDEEEDDDEDIANDEIWIHPQFIPSAILTAKFLKGDIRYDPRANGDTSKMENQSTVDKDVELTTTLKKLIFSSYYQIKSPSKFSEILKNFNNYDFKIKNDNILDLFRIIGPTHRHSYNEDVNDDHENLKSLLISSIFQKLIKNFIDNISLMMPIYFKGNIYETLIMPMLLQIIGQVILDDDVNDDLKINNNNETLTKLIKRLVLKEVLCLSSFIKYKKLLLEKKDITITTNAEDYESNYFLQLSIELRNSIIYDLGKIALEFQKNDDENPSTSANSNDNIKNTNLLDILIRQYEIKDLLLVFILVIKIDYFFNILENFRDWFSITDELISYLNNYNDSILLSLNKGNDPRSRLTLDKYVNLRKLIKLYRFMKIFYFSTAKINIETYSVPNEEFDDLVTGDYNLTGAFIFDDGFNKLDDFLNLNIDFDDATIINNNNNILLEDKQQFPNFVSTFGRSGGSPLTDQPSSSKNLRTSTAALKRAQELHFQSLPLVATSPKFPKLPKLIDIPYPTSDTVFFGDIDDNNENFSSVEFMYGIPMSLLELFNKIITLANHKNFFDRKKLFPRNYPRLCTELEQDLMNWKLNWKLKNEDQFISVFHEIMFHNIISFYNSLVIYFSRIIRDKDPMLLQQNVESSINHLEKLWNLSETLQRNQAKNFNNSARERELNQIFKIQPLFWSFFISGCDAIKNDLQQRFLKMFPNFYYNDHWISKQVMLEIWKKRSDHDYEIYWLEAVKIWETDVLLS
ncbi:hypothetical protein PACTADRAFT_31340 [Pachysolen tannophilus NRRL Y-2460]|uniref:Zn(2)-C6 fungal-type domain-containing protein n=1 Tax=Pachysolen tannophilus NRRL Y-2460 TaxID=669874 RepID=A0A1E4U1P5_PACTA|nr:hypothetical protein PACTADRAFT_31340 [Pachysolen tannophilus NRRL Y-2460]